LSNEYLPDSFIFAAFFSKTGKAIPRLRWDMLLETLLSITREKWSSDFREK
jgi:hypothetical protein